MGRIDIKIDVERPCLYTGIPETIKQSIYGYIDKNQDLFGLIEEINVFISIKEKPQNKSEVDWSKVRIGTKVFVGDSKETLEGSILDAVFVSYDPRHNSFWVLRPNGGKQPKSFRFCKLAEPMKPEWEKK